MREKRMREKLDNAERNKNSKKLQYYENFNKILTKINNIKQKKKKETQNSSSIPRVLLTNLDAGLDSPLVKRANGVSLGPFDQFQVSQGGQFQPNVLERFLRLIDHQDI